MTRVPSESLLDEFLAFEEVSGALDFRISADSVPAWLLIRFEVFGQLLSQSLGMQTPHASESPLKPSEWIKYAGALARYDPLRLRSQHRILIFGSAHDDTVRLEGGYYNKVHDAFALEYPDDTLLIEDSARRRFPLPRFFRNFAAHDSLKARAILASKFSRHHQDDAKAIEALAQKMGKAFSLDPDFLDRVRHGLSEIARRIPHLKRAYADLFESVRPRILFLNCACYGVEAYLMKWAKEAGIVTAEFQHGLIVKNHLAYQHSPRLLNDPGYRQWFPDYFLSYGAFTNKNLSIPSPRVITIGSPQIQERMEALRRANKAPNPRPRVLIVSQGTITSDLVQLALDLSVLPRADEWDIQFRLHPGEIPFEERYRALEGHPRIALSRTGDFYELLASADFVVGSSSTGLFEAAAMGKPVFVHENADSAFYTPRDFGLWFRTAGELHGFLLGDRRSAGMDAGAFFEPDWKTRYRGFISGILHAA